MSGHSAMSATAALCPVGARAAPKRRLRLSWTDQTLRAVVWQVLIVGVVMLIGWYLISNTNRNLAARHIATGFGFLGRVAGIPIGELPIPYDPAVNTYGRALWIGVLNTMKVSVPGIVLATTLGTLVGIGRLSGNWLLARLTALYVETLRDIPLLLQLLFWYALLHNLPGPRQAWRIGDAVFLSNRGIRLPLPIWQPAHAWTLLAFGVGLAGTMLWTGHCRHHEAAAGRRRARWPMALALLVALPIAAWSVLDLPLTWERPVLRGFNFQGGGSITPEYFALLLGLVIYTAAYIAEIVRSGIQAVPRGQWEGGAALGLRRGVVLRRIVLPQALRVIIPPLTSQFLNLTKNSSLAVAIGYQDVVSIADTTLNQTGQAIEGIAAIMAVYLTISLTISAFMSWYDRHVAPAGQ